MATLTRQEVEQMLANKPENVTNEQVIKSLSSRGYEIEGLTLPSQQKIENTNGGNFLQKTGETLGNVFGGNVVGQAIGRQIAKGNLGETVQKFAVGKDLSPEEEALVEAGPSGKEVVADIGRSALTFAPVGKVAGLVTKGLGKLGIGAGAKTIGQAVSGGVTGGLADIAVSVSEGGEANLGLGATLGAGIPVASPIVGAIGKASAKLAGRGASELTGKLTGTSQETVEQAFLSSRKGGKDMEAFTNALRGKTSPEKLVNNMRESIALISSQRSQLYSDTLDELAGVTVSTQPAKDNFRKTLESVGITVNNDNTLNFANNKLRTVPTAQAKLQQAWEEIMKMPETQTLKEIDTTRQAVKGIKSIAGDDPSANLANMLVEDATRSVRLAGEQVDGYGKMLDNFGETSEFLTELEKGVSSGDKSTIDQAYRRIATTLKTNNEQRMSLVKELDEATGGSLLADISGQQLSEDLPRGLVGTYLAPVIAGGAIAGGVSPAIIPSLLLASPRAVGEFARALGLGVAKTEALIDAVAETKSLLIKAGALTGAEIDNTSDNTVEENSN